MEKLAGAPAGVGEQLFERDRLPGIVDCGVGEALADGVGEFHLARFDQSRDHRRRDGLGDGAEVPAVADLKSHPAPIPPLSVDRRLHDLAVDHNHRCEPNEFVLPYEGGGSSP